MFIGGDYVFSWWNFIGLNISALATVLYTKATFGRSTKNSTGMQHTNINKQSPLVERDNIPIREGSGVSVRQKRIDTEQTASLLKNMEGE